jgi:adenine phosphoribosyltransferase
MDLNAYIRDVPDFPKPGVLFKDITPLLADPTAFGYTVARMAAHYATAKLGAVAAAEARGFLFAAPMALELSCSLIPMRKPGKLPYSTLAYSYALEYGAAELHMHVDAVKPGSRVLMIDDVLATGGTMKAGCQLIEKAGGTVAGCVFLIELGFLDGRAKLAPAEVFSVVRY